MANIVNIKEYGGVYKVYLSVWKWKDIIAVYFAEYSKNKKVWVVERFSE